MKRVCNEPLSSALRMTKVDNLFSSSSLENVVKISWYIILAHLMESKVPELFVFNGIVEVLV